MAVTYDVAVIGGGITGISAALAAHHRGASTCLLRAAPGATALASGAWRGPLRDEIRHALSGAGYVLAHSPLPLPHQRGDLVQSDFAGASHVGTVAEGPTLVCGIVGLPGFNAHALARLWEREHRLTSTVVEFRDTPAGGWASASLAAFLERSPDELIRALGGAAGRRVILPPVLGLEPTNHILERLKTAGIDAMEALATTPSIPGWRLHNAIERVLAARNITVFDGRASAETANGRVQSIRYGNDVVNAKSFVLASGKFLTGGITTTDTFAESAFGLPIWLEHLGDVFTAPDALPLTDPVRSEPQPLLFAGVHTDELLRPVNRSLDVVYENVFAAGTIRAGWSVADSGLGHCANDGWTAGVNATA